MSRLTNALRIIAGIGLAVLAASCGSDGDRITTPGSGSRSPNAPAFIAGRVTYEDGSAPVVGDAEVTLFRIYTDNDGEYTWSEAGRMYTEENGAYRFDSLGAGEYSVITREDPYLPTGDALLNGFGGYVNITEDDTGNAAPDTVVLRAQHMVIGRISGSSSGDIRVSIVGTGLSRVIPYDPYFPADFVFGSLPIGEFRLKVVTDYGTPAARSYIAPLPVRAAYGSDTTYYKSTYDYNTLVTIQDNSVTLQNSLFTLVYDVEEDRFAKAASSKAADGDGRPQPTIYR